MNEQQQKAYVQFKVVEEQIQQASQQLDELEQQQVQLHNTLQALNDLPSVTSDKKVLIPIASHIFVEGHISNTSKLLVNVTGNTTVEKNLEDTKKIVEDQIDELSEFEKKLTTHLMDLSKKADEINSELTT